MLIPKLEAIHFSPVVCEILLLRHFLHFFTPLYTRFYYCAEFSTFSPLVYEILLQRQILHFFTPSIFDMPSMEIARE